MILDATAGNRTMWRMKKHEDIIYIDRQTQLEVKPDIFCNHWCTPFQDKIFDAIFYDPPHSFNNTNHYHAYPRRTEEYIEKWKDTAIPRYYGWDIYKSWGELIRSVYRASEEFRRILKDDGMLWIKWNEMEQSVSKIEAAFMSWNQMLKLAIKSPTQTASDKQTWWLCYMKDLGYIRSAMLL